MKTGSVIAAVKNEEAMLDACKSGVNMIFDLAPSIETIENSVMLCKKHDKLLFIHIDLAEGIGKDKAGLRFVRDCGVDGIISTRISLIKTANEIGLKTIQRIFVLDSQSMETSASMLKVEPTMVEMMPGVIAPRIISQMCENIGIPVIAGGLISCETEVDLAISAGAVAISTGKKELWNYQRVL